MCNARLCVLVIAISCCAVSCGPKKVEPEPVRVWSVDVRTLHNSYRDRSYRWTNQTVRFYLEPKSYAVEGNSLWWRTGRPTEPPSIIIDCSGPVPADNSVRLEIVANCVGSVEDGKARGTGCTFFVFLVAKSVAVCP